ncbi:MAG: hypothetical protein E7391_08560 [Ruminococcaceae bacterium]|nr:hypothetical protein [Oscillospiraceae bacterium]
MNINSTKEPVYDTKGTGIGQKFLMIIIGFIIMIGGFFILMELPDFFEKKHNESELEMFLRSFLMMAPVWLGAALIGFSLLWNGTYIQVFDDHIQGTGLCGKNNNKETFYLTYKQIDNITTSKSIISINSAGKTYKVLANNDIAQKIFTYCYNKKGNLQL